MSSTIKRMYKLQKLKIDLMFDTIQAISEVLAKNYDRIPDDILSECVKYLNNFLIGNDRIDNARQRNINNFYDNIRNKYEDIYNMEVQDEEEKEEE